MASVRGRESVSSYIKGAPERLAKVLRGAGREGGKVFAEYVKENTTSEDVREGVRIRTKLDGDHVTTTVDVKHGWGRSVGIWNEWGTSAHFISVDDSQRGGRSVGRINQQVREADGDRSLVIGGEFVGTTVWHPGAQPHPVFRPARDLKAADALAAAQNYINTHVTRAGIIATAGDDE